MRDPYLVLKVGLDADDATIHSAYLNALRNSPPERDIEQFQSIRTAYEAIRDKRSRLAYALFNHDQPSKIDLLDKAYPIQTSRRPTIDMFMNLLKERI